MKTWQHWTSRLLLAFALPGLAAAAAAAAPEGLSQRTMTIVVPYPPGATTDLTARLVAEKLQNRFGQPVIVENRPGASGNIGADYVARSAPDGHTLLMATDATHAGNYHLFKNPPLHPLRDATPITLAARNVIVLVARADLPANDIPGLVEYAKRNPGKLSFGSSGIGSPHHLSGELFNQIAGTDLLHVPYKGGAAAVTDLLGGNVALVFSSVAESLPYIQEGRLKVLGVTQAGRYPNLPDVPAIGEALPGFDVSSWLAFFGPAGIPDEVVAKLNQAIVDALRSPDVASRLDSVGLLVEAGSAEDLATQQRTAFDLRGKLVKAIGLTPE